MILGNKSKNSAEISQFMTVSKKYDNIPTLLISIQTISQYMFITY